MPRTVVDTFALPSLDSLDSTCSLLFSDVINERVRFYPLFMSYTR